MIRHANLTPDQRDQITDAILKKVKDHIMTSWDGEAFLNNMILRGVRGAYDLDDTELAQKSDDWGLSDLLDEMDVTWGHAE